MQRNITSKRRMTFTWQVVVQMFKSIWPIYACVLYLRDSLLFVNLKKRNLLYIIVFYEQHKITRLQLALIFCTIYYCFKLT